MGEWDIEAPKKEKIDVGCVIVQTENPSQSIFMPKVALLILFIFSAEVFIILPVFGDWVHDSFDELACLDVCIHFKYYY